MKPFNLDEALAGKPVITRYGRKVTHIMELPEWTGVRYPLYVRVEGPEGTFTATLDGKYMGDGVPSDSDLFMATEKKTVWVNLYRGDRSGLVVGGHPFFSREAAESANKESWSGFTYLGAHPVEYEE